MNNKLDNYLTDIYKNPQPASQNDIKEVENHFQIELPEDYKNFMLEYNGGEGELGKNSWLCLFPMNELIQINKDYESLMEQIPNYVLIGKDAADSGFAIRKPEGAFYSFGLMSDFKTDSIEFCGSNFLEFIKYLYEK